MFDADDLRDWRNHKVVDQDGNKIGTMEAVYYDTASDVAAFVSVQVGIVGRRRLTFVPVAGAHVAPDHVRVMVAKRAVKGAPEIDTDGELSAADEPALFAHYGLEYVPGASGERRLGRR